MGTRRHGGHGGIEDLPRPFGPADRWRSLRNNKKSVSGPLTHPFLVYSVLLLSIRDMLGYLALHPPGLLSSNTTYRPTPCFVHPTLYRCVGVNHSICRCQPLYVRVPTTLRVKSRQGSHDALKGNQGHGVGREGAQEAGDEAPPEAARAASR